MTTTVQAQLDDLATRVAAIEHVLELRRSAPEPEPAPQPEPVRTPWPAPAAPPVRLPEPLPRPVQRDPWIDLDSIDWSEAFGARALAIAGGVVTLLGVVFCFVLAVDNGWLGPDARVALGGAASVALLLAAIELRRRYGVTHAALAAAGAGIAGAYVTLLAATAIYHLIPNAAALGLAALIAATGVALAVRWDAQLVAALGLIGALLAPVAIAVQDGLSPIGTGFAAFILAGTAAVAIWQRWRALLIAGIAASSPQIVALVAQPEYRSQGTVSVLVLAGVFAAIYLATAIVEQLTRGDSEIDGLSSMLAFGAALLAAGSAYRLLGGAHAEGVALLAIALVYGSLSAAFLRRRNRDLSALLAAPAFTVGAFALAALLSGQPLVYAWAAEAAALAWLARRAKEIRFQLWSAVYAVLALGHLLALDAPLERLVETTADRAAAVPAVLAVAAALAVVAYEAGPWPGPRRTRGLLLRLDRWLAASQTELRTGAAWSAAVLALYALSLGVLALSPSFDWGHVALAAVWSAIGLALLLAAERTAVRGLRTAGAVVLSVAAGFVAVHAIALDETPRGWSLGIVAAALLAGGVLYDRYRRRPWSLNPLALVWAIASAVLADVAVQTLSDGTGGWNQLAIAAPYAVTAAVLLRRREQRDLATALWGLAAVLTAVGTATLLDGTAMVAAWSGIAVALAWIAHRAGEQRLLGGAAGYAGIALVATLTRVAPPEHLFTALAGRTGWGAALAVAVPVAAIAVAAARGPENLRRLGSPLVWLAGLLAVYGGSIAILALTGWAHGTSEASFRTGHTLVSAFWGLLALGLLYAGLTRWRSLRLAGLAVFGVALGKLFLFDLSSLSSITRALSFLAVGAILLVGGFFYQRLTAGSERHA